MNATIADLQARLDALRDHEHVQSAPAATWTITHNLDRYPNVHVIDSVGDDVEGEFVRYIDRNSLTVSFAGAFSGKAILT